MNIHGIDNVRSNNVRFSHEVFQLSVPPPFWKMTSIQISMHILKQFCKLVIGRPVGTNFCLIIIIIIIIIILLLLLLLLLLFNYNCEKYPLSPLKPRPLAFIEQYLPNIFDPVHSVHQSFMWFLWLNWRKSTFYPVTAPNDSKYWPIVTSSIQEPAASHCDVTMTDCFRVVSMDAFLAQFVKTRLCQVMERICGSVKCLPSDWQRAGIIICLFTNVIWNRKLNTAHWATKNTSCFNFFV